MVKQNSIALFPGQGSQSVGMASPITSEFPYTTKIFEEAEDAARLQIRKICNDGPEDQLKLTANQQPAILTVSIAVWTVLQEETGWKPEFFAGHSLGEYSALVASGRLPLQRAAALVRTRGQAMQEAVPEGIGAMAAVIGTIEEEKISEICKKVRAATGEVVEIANFNSATQRILSGHAGAVEQACKLISAMPGVTCKILPVSAPFHSSLMIKARDIMEPLLSDTPLIEQSSWIVPNLLGEFVTDYETRFLIEQIDHPVLWDQGLKHAQTRGVAHYVEVGPGRVLSSLAKRSLPKDTPIVATVDLAAAIKQLLRY